MKKLLSFFLLGGICIPPLSAQNEGGEITLQQTNQYANTLESAEFESLKANASPERLQLLEYWEEQAASSRSNLLDMFLSPIKSKRLTKAPKDGCYYGLGDARNSYVATGMSQGQCIKCEKEGGKLKTNQSYVWGLTQGNGKIIWGTNMNYQCTANYDAIGGGDASLNMGFKAEENSCYVCEFEDSEFGENMSDWHAPRIYYYDLKKKKTVDITPSEKNPVLAHTLGFRSAGTLDNVSFVAGPDLNRNMSIFAFDNNSSNCKMIGSWTMTGLPGFPDRKPFNIRRWVVAEGQLYCGVEWKNDKDGTSGGAILRWKKTLNASTTNPSEFFEVIGWTRGGTAELIYMNKRLYATTWPGCILCQSPEIPANKVFPAANTTTTWKELFSYAQYDPDMLMAQASGGGAMAVYKDQLYFGTMHMPLMGTMLATYIYQIDPNDNEAMLQTLIGTFRTAALFRYTESTGKVELLYGEKELPAYDMAAKKWVKKSTGMTPLYGKSGFNNIMNNYVWSMEVMNDKLYIGSMDWTSTLLTRIEGMLADKSYGAAAMKFLRGLASLTMTEGFDFVRIEGKNSKAKFLSTNGLGVQVQYGIRNMTQINNLLYLGTASPFNLHEQGGWELIEVAENKTYLGNLIKWAPMQMQYGQKLGEPQLNARAISEYNGTEITGTYDYTVMSEDATAVEYLTPGIYNLRVKFTPDNDDYDIVNQLTKINVTKKRLIVSADTIEIDNKEELPNSYPYSITGFVKGDDKSVLTTLPTAIANIVGDAVDGNYEIMVSGGESDLYDFEYKTGLLILKNVTGLMEGMNKTFSLYPVPVKDVLTIQSESPVIRVVITNMTGSEVLSTNNPEPTINLSDLSNGIYLITVKTEDKTFTRKISKAN